MKKGIIFIYDLFDNEGIMLTFETFRNKYQIKTGVTTTLNKYEIMFGILEGEQKYVMNWLIFNIKYIYNMKIL